MSSLGSRCLVNFTGRLTCPLAWRHRKNGFIAIAIGKEGSQGTETSLIALDGARGEVFRISAFAQVFREKIRDREVTFSVFVMLCGQRCFAWLTTKDVTC